MALPTTDGDWVQFLSLQHDAIKPGLSMLDSYYEGTQPLSYMHPEVMREVGDRIRPLVIFWPQMVVDALEERLEPEGFRLPDQDAADDDLWRVWQANDLDEESQMGRVDALVMRRSYMAVGANSEDSDTPLVTVESPLEMYAHLDPRTRRPMAALKRIVEVDSIARVQERYATLYLPERTVWYDWAEGGWRVIDQDDHRLGEVPVVPVVNRGRSADRYGRSELTPILPLSDAANKTATDMMVGAESHAIPLRAIFGVGPEEIVDKDGKQLSAIQVIMRKLLAIGGGVNGSDVKAHEFSASDLANFHNTIRLLAELVASMSGLPPHYLGQSTANPASADAIRSAEARLIKRAERRQTAFGGSYERSARLIRRFQAGEWDPRLARLETIWREASTPTVAQQADAAVKKYQLRIVPLRQTREDLGYTDGQIRRMEADDERERRQNPLEAIARGLGGEPGPVAG